MLAQYAFQGLTIDEVSLLPFDHLLYQIMAATEQTILTTFLLAPSSLTTVFTFQSFQALFPRAQQSSPEIKRLYRSLQHRRALITDTVAQNIDDEVERGNSQRRAVIRARRAAERQQPDEEVAVENAVCISSLSGWT